MNFDLDHTSDDGYAAEAIVPQMLAMLQDLVHHKNYANSALLNAIAENEQASADTELRHLLHHILLANRFWVALSARQPFDLDNESRVPESLQAIATLYRETALSHCGMRAGAYRAESVCHRFRRVQYSHILCFRRTKRRR